jgi:type I restriction enzyme R subunit
MISENFTESVVEQAALAWLESLDYTVIAGPQIAPGEAQSERDDYRQVVLLRRLRQALQRLNPQVPSDALEEAFRKLSRMEAHPLATSNHAAHKYLVEGVPVEFACWTSPIPTTTNSWPSANSR